MATVEQYSGGQIKLRNREGRNLYRFNHWSSRAAEAGPLRRRKHLIDRLVNTLALTDDGQGGRVLGDAGNLLRGIIRNATGKRVEEVAELDDYEAAKLIEALTAIGHRHGDVWNSPPAETPRSFG